jgi:hypothetical protein
VTAGGTAGPPISRLLSWLVGCALAGWFVVYNVMRITGSNPSDAALPSLLIGVAVGVAVFAVGLLVVRRLAAAGRVVAPAPVEIPHGSQLEPAQKDAMTFAWPALAGLAAVALVVGAWLVGDWYSQDADARATTTLILGAWNVLVALWLGDEALRLRRLDPDGIESIPLGCGLTAVLAGVGWSRDLIAPAQVVLIVLAAVAGCLVALAVWRLRGARGAPVGAIGVVAVAALSLILPVIL